MSFQRGDFHDLSPLELSKNIEFLIDNYNLFSCVACHYLFPDDDAVVGCAFENCCIEMCEKCYDKYETAWKSCPKCFVTVCSSHSECPSGHWISEKKQKK
jgi:hypothetical protein